ncbi:MFS transporter [Kribbella qitaiheensis]|uniref:MFS transporter n=1 Tax=Kribbella qitaiheensis TaxID=1544730 RepID=A0A7G6WSQ3_9ACTN|nr:MFS transporter [Kribbella qitaiheensis]QNE17018.1 MFS transporter [Kribbella qitaiheensis]
MTTLVQNREYRLLWTSQAASEFGFSTAMIAFPLVVLTTTGSATASGLVLGAAAAARLLAGVPAGVLIDRWNRKTVMVVCEAVQALAVASLVVALWWDVASVAHMVVVAAILGLCTALFEPAEYSCLPALVPARQLPAAVAMNTARSHLGQLAGTAAGGFLFAVGRFLPFAVEVLSHLFACIRLMFLRVPPRTQRRESTSRFRDELGEGLRWMWRQRHIRAVALCAVSLNAFFTAYYIVIIVLTAARGVTAGEIGVMAAMLGAGGILGAVAAPALCRRLSPYALIVMVFWVLAVLAPLAVVIDSGYLMGALFAAMAFLPPSANTAIATQQLLLTPERMRGRLSGVMAVATGTASAVGPPLGGLLAELLPGSRAVLLCTAGMAAVALLATIAPPLRTFPRLTDAVADSPRQKGTPDG